MRAALSVFWRSLQYWSDEAFLLMQMNAAWLLSMVLVIPGPPATAAIFAVTNRIAHGELVSWRIAQDAFRRYFWKAWGWMLVNLAFVALLYYNYMFYAQQTSGVVWTMVRVAWVIFALSWGAVQIYWWPLMLEMPRAPLILALRNAVRLMTLNPFFTAIVLLLSLLITAISLILVPLVIIAWVSLLALIANHATLDRLAAYREMQAHLSEEEAEEMALIGMAKPSTRPIVEPRPPRPRSRRARRRQKRKAARRKATRR